MKPESQHLEKKSLRAVTAKTADWSELAKDCVAFAKRVNCVLMEKKVDVYTGHCRFIDAIGPNKGRYVHNLRQ